MIAPVNTYTHVTAPNTVYVQSATVPTGYVRKPLLGHIETTNTGRPLMRLYKGELRHYTDDPAERTAMEANGWVYNARVGYLQPAGTPMTAPIYRLTYAGGHQILTTDRIERDAMVANGWTHDGTLGNVTNMQLYADDTHFSKTYDPADVRIDFEKPGFSDFYRLYSVDPPTPDQGIQFVTSPRNQGDFAGRFALKGAGDTSVAHGDRSEIVLNQPMSRGFEGGEAWFGWSTLFNDEFNINTANLGTGAAKGGVIFANFHQTNNATSIDPICGPVWQAVVDVKTNPITIRSQLRGGWSVDGGCTPSTYSQVNLPFARDVWHDFVIHVRWSFYDKDDTHEGGLFELWHNGVKVQEVLGKATLMDDQYVYWKMGNYRPADWDQPSVIYHDNFRRGSSYAEVAP